MIFKSLIVLLIGSISIGQASKCFEYKGASCELSGDSQPIDCAAVEYDMFGFPKKFDLSWKTILKHGEELSSKSANSISYEYNCINAALPENVIMRSCFRGIRKDFEILQEELTVCTEFCDKDGCNDQKFDANICESKVTTTTTKNPSSSTEESKSSTDDSKSSTEGSKDSTEGSNSSTEDSKGSTADSNNPDNAATSVMTLGVLTLLLPLVNFMLH